MTGRPILVELQRQSATVRGPYLMQVLDRAGARWHWHPHSHRAVCVHLADVGDFVSAAESLGRRVEVTDRNGDALPYGGLLGGVA